MKVRILGSGTSSGVPRIGGDWGDCDPIEPRNRRTRASIQIEADGVRVLVDTSPDLRAQLLAAEVSAIDAVIWTHDHADHCHGIDDLRQLYHARGAPVPGYARSDTVIALQRRFGYAFDGHSGYPPIATITPLPDRMMLGGIAIAAVDQPHGAITSAGLCFTYNGRTIAYSTDFNAMTDAMRALFTGVDLWIVDALRRRPHPTHPHLDRTLGWIAELGPKRAVLTHMDQSMDFATLMRELPPGIEPGYDGMELVP